MGCSSSQMTIIKDDEETAEIISNITNQRIKTNLFPEGEIYYLRHRELDPDDPWVPTMVRKKTQVPKNKNVLSYEHIFVELSLRWVFKDENMIHDFVGTEIKFYHSDINLNSQFSYRGSTEPFEDDNPEFKQKFKMAYCFQKVQKIRLELWFKNTIQVVNTTWGSLIGSRDLKVKLPFFYGKSSENVAVEINCCVCKDENKNSFVSWSLATDWSPLPYSDYFVIISNWNMKSQPMKVWKSPELSGKMFVFTASMITLQDLCGGDNTQNITFDFYGIYSGLIGSTTTTLIELENSMDNKTKNEIVFHLPDQIKKNKPINEEKELKKKQNKEITRYFYVNYKIERISRFIDWIENGWQISLSVAIDYTASNKDPTDPESLHYINLKDRNYHNQYELAIHTAGRIISCYDFDQQIPVYGFGGVIPETEETSHCFNINFKNEPEIYGIDGVWKAYKDSWLKVKLDGPTYFGPLLKQAIKNIKDNKSETSTYHILLIITDGTIHDIEETKSLIIKACCLPFSIVIVGVGDEDFTKMLELDGDTEELCDKNGNKAGRDIVQFVSFNEFKEDPVLWAEQVLLEIPTQIEQYFRRFPDFTGLNGKMAAVRNLNIKSNPTETSGISKLPSLKLSSNFVTPTSNKKNVKFKNEIDEDKPKDTMLNLNTITHTTNWSTVGNQKNKKS